jgi:hypothetical protein
MERYLASLIASSALGCSLIYNPNNLPTQTPRDADSDAEVDAYVADANPAAVQLLDVGPAMLFEGQGVGGARPAVLALVGHQFVGPATVELVLSSSLPRAPVITVDNAAQQIAPGRDVVMVPVSVAIDTMLDDMTIPVVVKISQGDGMGGIVSTMLENKLQIRMLRELDAPQTDSAVVSGTLYSRVQVPAGIAFVRGPGKPPAAIRAISKIELGAMNVSANNATPGPGGFAGGAAGADGNGNGGGHAGNATTAGGSGAGFASMGDPGGGGTVAGPAIGDPLISTYAGSGIVPNYGSGGGGAAGAGGGGGGTLELSAGGDLVVGNVNASGGAGTSGLTGAGGGAGGAILLRAGGKLSLAGVTISAAGGPRGAGTGLTANGGEGSEGRIRIDAATTMGTPTITAGAFHAGASFDAAIPLTTTDANPSLMIHGSAGDQFDARVFDAAAALRSISTFEITGAQTAMARPMLEAGYNRVCISPKNSGTNPESTTCIELAYLP